jgi:DNA-binding CsgD family transcriptional regulator
MLQNRRQMGRRPFRHIRDQVTNRWTVWRLARWCERLSRANHVDFDALVSQMPAMRTPHQKTTPAAHHLVDAIQQRDDQLEAAVAELRLEEKILLHLLTQGASYDEMCARLQISDERLRQDLKSILRRLADRLGQQNL